MPAFFIKTAIPGKCSVLLLAMEKINLRELKTLLPFIKKFKWFYISGFIAIILVDIGEITIPALIGRSVNIISAGKDANLLKSVILQILIISILIAPGRFLWRVLIIGSARRIETDLRELIFTKFTLLTASFFNRHKTGDLMARATNDLRAVRMAIGMATVAFIDGLFISILVLGRIFYKYGLLGLVIVAPLPVITVIALTLGKYIGPLFKKVQENFAKISDFIQESFSGIKVIKSYVLEKITLKKFEKINSKYGHSNMKLVLIWGMVFPAMGFITGLSTLFLLYFGGLKVIENTFNAGDFAVMLSYLGMLLWPAMGVGWVVNMLRRGTASMKRINEILNVKPEITDLPDALETPVNGNIEIKSLNYSYPSGTRILYGIDLTIHKGTSLGLLGRTGSGKTTIVKLLIRMLDPPENSVYISGKDIKQYKRHSLRKSIAVVPQDIFLFSDTIKGNITFALPDADKEAVEQAVNLSGLSADLPFFPEGLETQIGEKGIVLSGGQKQRIAIARAIILDPGILILDDALSAVDSETEKLILDNIFKIRKNKTTLIISHRISALSRCDNCAVLEKGRITAFGPPEELTVKSDFYRYIEELQQLEKIEEESA